MKTCGICKTAKPLSEFAAKGEGYQWQCRTCQADYRRAHYNRNKQKYIDKARKNENKYKQEYLDWLSEQSCMDCGNSDLRVLELDHLRDKEFSLGSKFGERPLSSLMDEIEKCDVVCANCHRIRTTARGNYARGNYVSLVQ